MPNMLITIAWASLRGAEQIGKAEKTKFGERSRFTQDYPVYFGKAEKNTNIKFGGRSRGRFLGKF